MTLTLVKSGRGSEKIFRCPTQKGEKIALTKDSYFHNQHLTSKNIVELLFFWAFKLPVTDVAELTGLSNPSCIQWFAYFRDVCSTALLTHQYTIGGPGKVVEIDESLIAKKKTVGGVGVGHDVPERWVFGGVDRRTRLGFLVEVPGRTAATLLPIIQRYIAPGTDINSDGWLAYTGIRQLPVNPPFTLTAS